MDLTCVRFFFFNDTATTEIYTLSLHDALPISASGSGRSRQTAWRQFGDIDWSSFGAGDTLYIIGDRCGPAYAETLDRKSTRLNSSHANISYAVFCLKKKKTTDTHNIHLICYSH